MAYIHAPPPKIELNNVRVGYNIGWGWLWAGLRQGCTWGGGSGMTRMDGYQKHLMRYPFKPFLNFP